MYWCIWFYANLCCIYVAHHKLTYWNGRWFCVGLNRFSFVAVFWNWWLWTYRSVSANIAKLFYYCTQLHSQLTIERMFSVLINCGFFSTRSFLLHLSGLSCNRTLPLPPSCTNCGLGLSSFLTVKVRFFVCSCSSVSQDAIINSMMAVLIMNWCTRLKPARSTSHPSIPSIHPSISAFMHRGSPSPSNHIHPIYPLISILPNIDFILLNVEIMILVPLQCIHAIWFH